VIRALVPLLAALALGAEDLAPQPALPPESKPLMLAPAGDAPRARDLHQAERARLGDDLDALKRAVARVRAALAADPAHAGHGRDDDGASDHAALADHGDAPAAGEARASALFALTAQPLADGGALITADVRQERLERIYRDLAQLVGMPLDDSRLMGTHGLASLRVVDLPWQDALDRLLGQAGLYWRQEGEGAAAKIVVLDPGLERPETPRLEKLAYHALSAAAQSDGAIAVEAQFRIGEHDARASRRFAAIRTWHSLVERHIGSKDPRINAWVMKALSGVAEQMAALERHQDAKAVYVDWLGRARNDDPALATVHLACAEQSLALARATDDLSSLDDAIDTLHQLLERCADQPRWTTEIARGRLLLGELLLDAGRPREAAVHLERFAASAATVDDQVSFWIAECDVALDRHAKAAPAYEELLARWRRRRADATADESVYATAAFRIGQCRLAESPPRHVPALFAFLRAQQEFPDSPVEAEVLVNIARCYSEIEREDDSIAALWDLLQTDAVVDPRPGRLQLDQLLGDLEGRIAAYPGPVRARVLFHIAQANWRAAVRDRAERERLVGEAVHRYERVIAEDPPAELAAAARLGLARVAFLGGQDELGERTIRELMADRGLGARDRDLAAQLMGNHYRAQGKLREAIAAYAGDLE